VPFFIFIVKCRRPGHPALQAGQQGFKSPWGRPSESKVVGINLAAFFIVGVKGRWIEHFAFYEGQQLRSGVVG